MECNWIDAGNRLRELRKQSKLSIFKAAKNAHISGNYLSLLERGKRSPSDTVLFNLAEFYNTDPSELFRLYDRIVPPTNQQLQEMPSLKGLITQISIDKKLTSEEKESVANQIYEIARNLNKKE